jgi:hypothetical protein
VGELIGFIGIVLTALGVLIAWLAYRYMRSQKPETRPSEPPTTGDTERTVIREESPSFGDVTGVAAGRDISGVATGGDVRDSNIVTGDRPIIADKVIYGAAGSPTTATSLHQLPAPPADFTGRKAELDELLDKIGEGGVTISGIQGMGGIGKTALALKLAE